MLPVDPRVREMIHQLISPPQSRDADNGQGPQSDDEDSVASDEIVVTGQGAHSGKVLGLAFGSIMVETDGRRGDRGLLFMQDSELDGAQGDVSAAASNAEQVPPAKEDTMAEKQDQEPLPQSVDQSGAIAQGDNAHVAQKTDDPSSEPKPFETQVSWLNQVGQDAAE